MLEGLGAEPEPDEAIALARTEASCCRTSGFCKAVMAAACRGSKGPDILCGPSGGGLAGCSRGGRGLVRQGAKDGTLSGGASSKQLVGNS